MEVSAAASAPAPGTADEGQEITIQPYSLKVAAGAGRVRDPQPRVLPCRDDGAVSRVKFKNAEAIGIGLALAS
jgi:hypothetical protein